MSATVIINKLLLIVIIAKENQSRKHDIVDVWSCLGACSVSLILEPRVLHAALSPFLLATSRFLHDLCIHVVNMITLLEASFFNKGV